MITLPELAAWMRCDRSTIYRLLKRKRIPAFRIGQDWRFNVESIEKWMRDQSSIGKS